MLKRLWYKYLFGKSTQWVDVSYKDGKLVVKDFNKAFADTARQKLGELVADKTDHRAVEIFFNRENVEHEEPRLEVLHSAINEDGSVKMELDWNTAFIKMLADNGIVAETEEEAVQMYLSLLTKNAVETGEVDPELIGEAFKELDEQLQRELDEAAQQAKEEKPKRRRRTKRTLAP